MGNKNLNRGILGKKRKVACWNKQPIINIPDGIFQQTDVYHDEP